MTTVSSRSPKVAELIRDRKEFKTYGALHAQTWTKGAGYLSGKDLAKWERDVSKIVYVVYSYSTPIAWVVKSGRHHKVEQKFSVTTGRHQGKLYLLGEGKKK